MERVISKRQLVLGLFFSYAILLAHTLADPHEVAKKAFIAHRHLQREEARLSARITSPNLQSRRAVISGVEKPDGGTIIIEDANQANWAGAVQSTPPAGTFNSVSAQWILPAVTPPPSSGGAGTWWASELVGIDGAGSCTTASLEAGVFAFITVSDSGDVTSGALAWYQWYPQSLTDIASFPVTAGDEVQISVTAASPSQGTLVVDNLGTGQSRTVTVTAPSPNNNLCGSSVEWVVESMTDPNTGALDPLARFDSVFFQNCAASTTASSSVSLNGASLLNIASNGAQLTTVTTCSSTELEVDYNDPYIPITPCGHR